MTEKPKLRPVQAIPFQSEGEQVVCLRDPAGLSRKTVVLTARAFLVAALCDGEHALRDIQAEYIHRFGDLLEIEKIQEMVRQLDEAMLLESPRFEAHRRQVMEEFERNPVRRATLAGTSYPSQSASLKQSLSRYFSVSQGPGAIDPVKRGKRVIAAAAPHIDIRHAGATYAHAWKALAEGCPAETFVVLGIAHAPGKQLYVATDKDFETPLGAVPCDRALTHELIRRAGLKRGEEELIHRGEHSIEFQAVWLRHVYGASRPARIVPVLCGEILEAVGQAEDPLAVPAVGRFVTALREILAEQGERVALVASVDLSHVGKKFGDDDSLSPTLLSGIEAEDRALLAHAEKGDARAFFDHNRREGDRRHVCGFGALYTLLAAAQPKRGHLLHYGQSPERETDSVVSYAAMAFERETSRL